MRGKPWTHEQDKALLQGLGTYGYRWLQSRTGGRTKKAIMRRADRLFSSGITRGAYPLNKVVTSTGYSKSQLLRAQEALKHKWKRTAPKGAYLITEEQVGELVTWLRHDFWSKVKHRYCCVWCATETRASYALGLCRRCYDRYRYQCKKRELPIPLEDMRKLVATILTGAIHAKHATFLERVKVHVGKGLALSMEQLEWVEMLKP